MAAKNTNIFSLIFNCFIFLGLAHLNLVNALSPNYYDQTCPNAESTITSVVKKAMLNDPTVPAALLRMHFHDCFIRNKAEKDGPPNISLHAFYVIDNAKKAVEALCPKTVSCADILALAARDAVTMSGGPWDVPKGRKDGTVSKASETRQLPAPTFNISQLQQSFAQRGLSMDDLVALSGGHTLGFAHCSSFQSRIHNFNSKQSVDPTLESSFAASLKSVCPVKNTAKNTGANLDSTPTTLDNRDYKLLLQVKSIFSSDQSLVTSTNTKALVSKFASSQQEFQKAFVKSMIKMSSIMIKMSSINVFFKIIHLNLVNALSPNYYDQTCPNAESTITSAVKKAMLNDPTVPAALLRMHFHDCFIRGCDGSVLLNSTGKKKAEKDGPPNISLHAFYVIDNAKKAVEALCPKTVSCADILALGARDVVTLSGGPTWDAPKGRKDGRVSKASETRQLPAPTFNISQLEQSFAQRGLSMDDLVALLGKSIFSSDQSLVTSTNTKALVSKFASSQQEFQKVFVKSMIKMSSINGGQEVRVDCRVVN
ncbi:hypothetical protein L1987_23617 [Smallanthus sonchifolius]|uniref:Uncharacterized protein n=1 Tax=Smallanthus sonchifolius TaxID=185202 RepID=A0ACB9IHG0_9ASTR|nr:hypothetical protein L1987_23617 [Smallanthus sonchifolius]